MVYTHSCIGIYVYLLFRIFSKYLCKGNIWILNFFKKMHLLPQSYCFVSMLNKKREGLTCNSAYHPFCPKVAYREMINTFWEIEKAPVSIIPNKQNVSGLYLWPILLVKMFIWFPSFSSDYKTQLQPFLPVTKYR